MEFSGRHGKPFVVCESPSDTFAGKTGIASSSHQCTCTKVGKNRSAPTNVKQFIAGTLSESLQRYERIAKLYENQLHATSTRSKWLHTDRKCWWRTVVHTSKACPNQTNTPGCAHTSANIALLSARETDVSDVDTVSSLLLLPQNPPKPGLNNLPPSCKASCYVFASRSKCQNPSRFRGVQPRRHMFQKISFCKV